MYILVINSGSATLKFKIFDAKNMKDTVWGAIERIGLPKSFLVIENNKGKSKFDYPAGVKTHALALKTLFHHLPVTPNQLAVIGHRVVHGGEEFTKPTIVNKKVLGRLKKYNKLAPLHNPVNIAGIEACLKILPGVRNVAVFDTAYYRTLPSHAFVYPLPYSFYEREGIRRYGFHGISHEYVALEAAKRLRRPLKKLKIITCHLGSGASITATKFGQAIDTSMGFTPLEGLEMSTRTGDLDPAIPLYLIRTLKYRPEEVDNILNKKSGLLGLTGKMDMREVLVAAKKGNRRAELAVKIFVYRAQKYIGAYSAIMGGVDAIVFTAGIGERSETIRKMILKDLGIPGRVKALVIPTNEELMIAKKAFNLI